MEYTVQRIQRLFETKVTRAIIHGAERRGLIPTAERNQGHVRTRQWALKDIPHIGRLWGFMSQPKSPICVTVFSTKGGVLKTTLSLNLARLAALHGISTCVVGVDLQGDVTNALGFGIPDDDSGIEGALDYLRKTPGLYALSPSQKTDLKIVDLVRSLPDLPTLSLIPETPDLELVDRDLGSLRSRQEFWLQQRVVEPLKEHYDLVIIDCGPSWNRLITNSLVACDLLISPIECKIGQYRGLAAFLDRIEEFKSENSLNFGHVLVPTLHNPMKRLSNDIFLDYQRKLKGCTRTSIKESIKTMEANALHMSLPEVYPTVPVAYEMRRLIAEIWARVPSIPKQKPTSVVEEDIAQMTGIGRAA